MSLGIKCASTKALRNSRSKSKLPSLLILTESSIMYTEYEMYMESIIICILYAYCILCLTPYKHGWKVELRGEGEGGSSSSSSLHPSNHIRRHSSSELLLLQHPSILLWNEQMIRFRKIQIQREKFPLHPAFLPRKKKETFSNFNGVSHHARPLGMRKKSATQYYLKNIWPLKHKYFTFFSVFMKNGIYSHKSYILVFLA